MLVDPELEWPLHQQLAAQLQAAIEDGEYRQGERLPSVRELSAMLRLNRNTIVHAYQMLEYAGYARSEPGRGYFAVMPVRRSLAPSQQQLLQETLGRLADRGEDPVAFAKALWARALKLAAKAECLLPPVRVAVVECTLEQASILAHDLSEKLGVDAMPVVLSGLDKLDSDDLKNFTLFVTTYQHVDEIKSLLPGRSRDILPCLLTAHLETLRRLKELPRNSKIGVACVSWEGTHRLAEMVQEAGFAELTVVEGTGEDPKTLPPLLDGTALIVSASPVAEILLAFRPDAPVVIDDRTFTEGAVESIRQRLAGGHRDHS